MNPPFCKVQNLGGQGPTDDKKDNPATRLYVLCQAFTPIGLVLTELQADCYAGVWAHHTQKRTQFLEEGDLEEGLNAAAQIGDDTLLRKAGHKPHPSMYTHGSS